MSKTDHLAKAKDYIVKGEDYYRKAAEEIVAWLAEDKSRTYAQAAEKLGRSARWVGDLIDWVKNPKRADEDGPYRGSEYADRKARQHTKRIVRQNPQAIAEAIAEAPKEAQRKIAAEIVKRPVESSLKSLATPREKKPRKASDLTPEQKVGDAVFALWEAGELLLDTVPGGESRVRTQALAEKAKRLADGIIHLLGTGELEEEFADLVREVRADA